MTDRVAYSLPERVDFDNLMTIRLEGERYVDTAEQPVFDLGGLGNSSSAAVALLVAWFRYAHDRGKVVQFIHVPTGIMNIIEVTELTDILPLEADVSAAPGAGS